MITENGIVTLADADTAWVKTVRAGSCEACSARGTCGTAQSDVKELVVCVPNTLRVKAGDHVVIGLKSAPMLFLAFLLYVFPVIFLIFGAFIGNSLAFLIPAANPSLISLASGISFFLLAFLIIRRQNQSLSTKAIFKPFLVRKRRSIISTGCSLS